jgi:ankyrin repeat protein
MKKTVKSDPASKQKELYDYKSKSINLIREQVQTTNKPAKNSLSDVIFKNNLELLKVMLQNPSINVNQTDGVGKNYSWTPLYWSVKLRRIECIKMLLECGVDVNAVVNDEDECFGTVLDLVTLRGDQEIEGLLREYVDVEDISMGQSFKAIRTKLRGNATAFNFRYYGKKTGT